jgi:hypothetical protein
MMRILASLCFVCCCACTYQLDDEVYKDVKPGVARPFEVNFVPGGTLYISEPTFIRVEFDPAGIDIVGTSVFLDNEEIYFTNDAISAYYFEPALYASGSHQLTFLYYQKSNSGSIADMAGAEVFYYYNWCTVVIDNDPVPMMYITNYEVVNGQLVIHWPAYTGPNFTSYTIKYGSGIEQTITDPQVTSMVIPEFKGGDITFLLTIRAKGKEVSNTVTHIERFDLQIEQTDFDSLRIRGTGSPYTGSELIMSFQSQGYDAAPIAQAIIPLGPGPLDTKIYFPIPFPYDYTIKRQIGGTPGLGGLPEQRVRSLWRNIQADLLYLKGGDKYLGFASNVFPGGEELLTFNSLYSPSEYSVSGHFGLSHDGKQLFRVTIPSTTSMQVYKLDPVTGSKIGETKTITIASSEQNVRGIVVSNDEYLLVSYGNYKFLLYHWPTGTIVQQGTEGQPEFPSWLSKGADRYLRQDSYMDMATHESFLTKPGSKAINLPGRNQYAYEDATASRVRLINFSDGSEQISYPVSGAVQRFTANEYNDLAIIIKKPDETYHVEIFDLDSGALLGRKRINANLAKSVVNDFTFQLSENWFRLREHDQGQYLLKFNFPL